MKYFFLIGLFFLLEEGTGFSQSTIGIPEIRNFEKYSYGAGAQNWDIRQDSNGVVYFANNEGMLSYDGSYWKNHPLPNKTIVRSLAFGSDNRIYIGAQDEFGYFSPNAGGKLVFHSLKPLLAEPDRSFADIWDIETEGDVLYFRSITGIFRLEKEKITVFKPASSWQFLGTHAGLPIAQDDSRGLLLFSNNQWGVLLPENQLPTGALITSSTPFGNDSTLLTTQKHGVFLLSKGKLEPFPLQYAANGSSQALTGLTAIDRNTFAISTYSNGIFIFNKKGTITRHFSRKNGLQNNTVRSIFADGNSNIWLGLDHGIDFIAFNNAITHIQPPELNYGAGYASLIHRNRLYLGLSNGIYSMELPAINDFSYAANTFTPVTGAEGQTWGLSLLNGGLFAGMDEGMFRIEGNTAIPQSRQTGFWTFRDLASENGRNLVAAGNYNGVRFFENGPDGLQNAGDVPGLKEPARFLETDHTQTLWASHPYRGVYAMKPRVTAQLYNAEHGLPSSLNNHVYKIKNRVVVATENGVYEYNAEKDAFQPSSWFARIFGNLALRYLKEDPSGNIWFVHEKNLGVARQTDTGFQLMYIPELDAKIFSGFEHIYPYNEENIFVGAEKGFYHINFRQYLRNRKNLRVVVRNVKTSGKKDSLLFGGYYGEVNSRAKQDRDRLPRVPYNQNSFHIEFASNLYGQNANIEYSYFLEGFDQNWSDWIKKTEKDYTNLPPGQYHFRVKARHNLGTESETAGYSFVVLPPWYRSMEAYALYIMLAGALAFLLYRRQQRKFLRQRQQHIAEQQHLAYMHQLEIDKSEKEIMSLRNEKLETEIGFKNSELATTAMHLVQKGEILTRIKDTLQKLIKKSKNEEEAESIRKLLRVLTEEEKMNDDWEQFAVHFNQVHSDFLIMLKEKYPELTAHEIKLCAYLRMNLSSKEMAQLMNISVRGVEISRYRLRKKLGLPTETNLFQFMMDVQMGAV